MAWVLKAIQVPGYNADTNGSSDVGANLSIDTGAEPEANTDTGASAGVDTDWALACRWLARMQGRKH
jgi:hypothetical protein